MPLDQIMLGLATPPVLGYGMSRVIGTAFYLQWSYCAAGGMVGAVFPPPAWVLGAANGVSLIVALVLWWLSRRRKKRAPKTVGAKSKARVAALVKTLRESLKPKPVLRPQPGGAS